MTLLNTWTRKTKTETIFLDVHDAIDTFSKLYGTNFRTII